ncbi:biotin/lipoyl-containing protein, partial [Enterobacter intestinihominis]
MRDTLHVSGARRCVLESDVAGIGADEVEITEILVKVGENVEAEQSLITVEGDKASM